MPRSHCHPQVAAFLDMLAYAEGTKGRGDDGYNKLVNPAGFFGDYSTHPNVSIIVRPGLVSTAGGVGQIGTYGFFVNVSGANRGPGDVVGGGGIVWSSGDQATNAGWSPAGTWKCLGFCSTYRNLGHAVTLWTRIA
ncbi:MAG: hypothetical protein ACRC4V_15995 [Aeromonas veronii]